MSKYQGIKTLEVLEGADNYNSWIASKISQFVSSPALEIGAGTGNITSFFTSLKELTVTDVDEALVDTLRSKFASKKNLKVEQLDISRDFGSVQNRFNSIYSVNVLEHIEDDIKALQNMYALLKKKGVVVLLVPAKKTAFSALDERLGHYRRYEKKELAKKMEKANFNVEYNEYFNILGLLSWIVRDRMTNDHAQLKKSQVKVFDLLVPILRLIEPKRGMPVGISLVAVGRK